MNKNREKAVKCFLAVLDEPDGPYLRTLQHSFAKSQLLMSKIADMVARQFDVDPQMLLAAEVDQRATILLGCKQK